jgi:hypothetical protein
VVAAAAMDHTPYPCRQRVSCSFSEHGQIMPASIKLNSAACDGPQLVVTCCQVAVKRNHHCVLLAVATSLQRVQGMTKSCFNCCLHADAAVPVVGCRLLAMHKVTTATDLPPLLPSPAEGPQRNRHDTLCSCLEPSPGPGEDGFAACSGRGGSASLVCTVLTALARCRMVQPPIQGWPLLQCHYRNVQGGE